MSSQPNTNQSAPVQSLVPLQGRSPWTVLPPLILGFFMIMVDTTIVNIAIPTLVREFDASLVAVGWVTSAYLLTFASLQLLAGRLGDRFGPRTIYIAGLLIFTIASAWCGLSGSIEMLIAARVVQGVGAALMTPQTMAVITRVFPPASRGAAMGLWGATAGVATIAGPVLGGVFVETWGWEWIFFVNVPIGLVALGFSLARLPKLKTQATPIDSIGVVLSLVGLLLVVFGIQEGSTYNWGTIVGPISVWLVIGVGLVVMGVFIWWQHRLGDRALLPLRLFAFRNFSLANIGGMAVSFAMIGIFFPTTIFLQVILGLSPLQAALINLPGSLISGVIAPIAGRLSDRIPGKWVVATGFAALAGSIGWLALVVRPDVPVWQLLLPMALFGVGSGCIFSPLANLATAGLDGRTAGAGAGAFNTTRQVGGVIGSAAIIAILTSRLGVTLPDAARKTAEALPDEYREKFVDGFSAVDLSGASLGGGAEMPLPEGVPAGIAHEVQALGLQAFHDGFAVAVGQTLLVTVGVALLGLLTTIGMRALPPAKR